MQSYITSLCAVACKKPAAFMCLFFFLSMRRELASNVDKIFAPDFISDSPCNLAFSVFVHTVLLLKDAVFFNKYFLFQVVYMTNIYSYSCKFWLSMRELFFQLHVFLDIRLCLHLKNIIIFRGGSLYIWSLI